MENHKEDEKVSYDGLYYLVGLLAGIFTGIVIDKSFMLILVLGVVGLLFAAFYLNVFVKGRGKA
jgi:hypothetical protein